MPAVGRPALTSGNVPDLRGPAPARRTIGQMSRFSGIPADAVAFYAELVENNNRQWWAAHKERYESSVRAPLLALIDALAEEFGEAKLFRPHRDIRFSADKTPYKDAQAAVAQLEGGVGFYLNVGRRGLTTGGGQHHNASDQVARYRAAVADDAGGEELREIVNTLQDKEFEIGGDLLKTRPKGIPEDHPRLELLRHKSIFAWRDHGIPHWLGKPEVLERVRADWRAIRPLGTWLAVHVGPPDQPDGRVRR